ncbi:SH3 domain-containing protein [Viridibacillus arvi]|uniref:SH3 domain-containing protein n=1 Tax=Viridibacillus arvi TaxID=263475 RepID=UPI0034CDB9C4
MKKLKQKFTKVLVAIAAIGLLSTQTITPAKAKINEDDVSYAKKTCVMVIDKVKHNYKKGEKIVRPSGICNKYEYGYYIKGSYGAQFNIKGPATYQVKYSGEQFVLGIPSNYAILTVYTTDTSKKITGKYMHIAKDKSANVYKSRNSKSKVLTKVKQNAKVKVMQVKGNWVKVKANNKTGWISRKYLVDTVTVTTNTTKNTNYKTITYDLPDYLNEEIVLQKGQKGTTKTTYLKKYTNGKLVSTKKDRTIIVKRPVDEIKYTKK